MWCVSSSLLEMKSLEELALGPCDRNIDAFLKEIPNNLNNLTKLILNQWNATDDGIAAISSMLTKKFTDDSDCE